MGRPPKDITHDEVRNLIAAGMSIRAVARLKGVSDTAIRKRFKAAIREGLANEEAWFITRLRAAIERGNIVAMIWYSKNRLKWSDKIEQSNDHRITIRDKTIALPGAVYGPKATASDIVELEDAKMLTDESGPTPAESSQPDTNGEKL